MHETAFSVPVRDLERSDQRRSWEIPPTWIDWALGESEARSDGTPGKLELYLKKTGREILVKGQAQAKVTMPCARTMEPVAVALDASILLLLSPSSPAPAGGGRGKRQRTRGEAGGAARADADEASGELLSAEEAARDEYSGDQVELDAFVREYLLLELPLFPVRSDLPFEADAATNTPPDESGAAPDPRLAPLAALASQLKTTGKLPKSSK